MIMEKIKTVNQLKRNLTNKLYVGCQKSATIVQDQTPIDTKRLYTSTRAGQVTVDGTSISCKIIAGGEELYGILKEQDILKPVNYALEVEIKYNYMRSCLNQCVDTILHELT